MATAPHLAFHLPFPFPSTSRPPSRALPQPLQRRAPLRLAAGRRFRPPTADDEPPEAAEDSSHGLNRYDQLARHVERARKRQQAEQPEVTADHPLFSSPPSAGGGSYDPDDEFFDEIDRAIAEKREEFTRRGLIKPTPPPLPEVDGPADELSPEEAIDLDEIRRLQGLSVAYVADEGGDVVDVGEEEDGSGGLPLDDDVEGFDVADELGLEGPRMRYPAFRMTLAELLDESKLVPLAVTGDQDVALAGVQSDASLVAAGDLFIEPPPLLFYVVIGCCGEKERGKRPMMTKIAAEKSDVVMLTSDNPASEDPLDILDDMLSGVGWTMEEYLKYGANDYYPPLPNGHRLFLHDIRRVAVRAAVAMGEQGDVVVVTGKGNDTYELEGDKREFFDDREECREALQYVDQLHRSGIDTSEFPWRLPESH
uniref:Uncharacterized protein n=1 Tax=Avena sativa TaxID=4498 RepID=A0ACD5U546_AVESA